MVNCAFLLSEKNEERYLAENLVDPEAVRIAEANEKVVAIR